MQPIRRIRKHLLFVPVAAALLIGGFAVGRYTGSSTPSTHPNAGILAGQRAKYDKQEFAPVLAAYRAHLFADRQQLKMLNGHDTLKRQILEENINQFTASLLQTEEELYSSRQASLNR